VDNPSPAVLRQLQVQLLRAQADAAAAQQDLAAEVARSTRLTEEAAEAERARGRADALVSRWRAPRDGQRVAGCV